jgi:secreted PhoX family phosphatase
VLTGVDNVVVSPWGDVLVAEDGGNQEIVAITPTGDVVPVVRIATHPQSEVTGPDFDPSGARLYFSSQRGATGRSADGITYEVTGPFGG